MQVDVVLLQRSEATRLSRSYATGAQLVANRPPLIAVGVAICLGNVVDSALAILSSESAPPSHLTLFLVDSGSRFGLFELSASRASIFAAAVVILLYRLDYRRSSGAQQRLDIGATDKSFW
ncbi:hypothetical protein B5807_05480 [Epicoccum nigrum]|uniref:Uncharacterized protein n=1 Tax=Epicoccum nigrum TaxID=105696 RepID=A0A1Y2M1E6_EPING|nr:hypothetical protein B5807_05480 [Epicoccum nigrum]